MKKKIKRRIGSRWKRRKERRRRGRRRGKEEECGNGNGGDYGDGDNGDDAKYDAKQIMPTCIKGSKSNAEFVLHTTRPPYRMQQVF